MSFASRFPHAHLITATFVIPIVATLVVEAIESIIDPSPWDWRDRQIKTGWDLFVLAVGSGGAIFTMPEVQKYLGMTFTVDVGQLAVLVTILLGLGIAAIRRVPSNRVGGWRATLALILGGTALTIPWYIVAHT
jgi:hypothetical protein